MKYTILYNFILYIILYYIISYYIILLNIVLIVCIQECPQDQDAFFKDYAKAGSGCSIARGLGFRVWDLGFRV